jgi:hypothetical protein
MADPSPHPEPWTPSLKQAAVLRAALETVGARTLSQICDAAQVARESLWLWLKEDADFRAAWHRVWKEQLEQHTPAVTSALVDRASTGNVPAMRLFYELRGDLKTKHEISGPGGAPIATEGRVDVTAHVPNPADVLAVFDILKLAGVAPVDLARPGKGAGPATAAGVSAAKVDTPPEAAGVPRPPSL